MKHIAAFALATLIGAPAFAGGMTTPIEEPIVAPAPVIAPTRADGDWSGFYTGIQLGYGDVNSSTDTLDGNGLIGGVHAGYRFDFGTYVVGAELDYDASKIDLGAGADELDSVTRLKLQAGADLGRTYLYGTLGAAYADATVGGVSLNDNGYFAGLGADYAVSDNWSVGSELLFHKFDNFDGSGVDLDVTTIKAKLSYQF